MTAHDVKVADAATGAAITITTGTAISAATNTASSTASSTVAGAQLVEACIGLVQKAESLRAPDLERVATLALASITDSTAYEPAMLAFAIERACDELIANRVAPGASLPALCMAADQLVNDAPGISAARFEIDTLLPPPGAAPASTPLLTSDSLLRHTGSPMSRLPNDPLLQLRARRLARAAACPPAHRSARAHYDT